MDGTRTRLSRILACVILAGALLTQMPGSASAQTSTEPPSEQSTLVERFEKVSRCLVIDGERFCTEVGFIGPATEAGNWKVRLGDVLMADVAGSGDMNLADLVPYLEQLPRAELAARQKEQVNAARQAARLVAAADAGLAKEVMQALPVPNDPGDLDPYNEEAIESRLGPTQSARLSWSAPLLWLAPSSRYIIYNYYMEQSTNYYCGPATFASIDWADDGGNNGQSFWAGSNYLRTDAQGATALSDIVSHINTYTNWDAVGTGGAYSMVSISGRDQTFFVDYHKVRIGVYGAPIVEHVMLRDEYFSYLAKDHGGHFQTGRGYSGSNIAIFEQH